MIVNMAQFVIVVIGHVQQMEGLILRANSLVFPLANPTSADEVSWCI